MTLPGPEPRNPPGTRRVSGLTSGVAWSIGSLVLISLSALVFSVIIEGYAGTAALGRFNVLLAVLLIGGQIGTVGMQVAVMYFTPRSASLGLATSSVIRSALSVVIRSSSVATIVVIGGGTVVLTLAGSADYRAGLLALSVGFWLYPINKTLAAHLNGLGRIAEFAIGQSARFVTMMLVVAAFGVAGLRSDLLIIAASVAEIVVTIYLTIILRRELFHPVPDGATGHVDPRSLIRFGTRGMVGGLLLDINTRVDVLVLGLLAGSNEVGLYSIASVFGEGLYQLAMVVRYSVEPRIARYVSLGQQSELSQLIRRTRNRVYLLIGATAAISVLLYDTAVGLLYSEELSGDTRMIFIILAIGVTISAGYIPFTNLLQQAGEPAWNSRLLAVVSAGNLTTNLALVPVLGAPGAAIGTVVAHCIFVVGIRRLARRLVDVHV